MTENLWRANRPQDFWLCQAALPEECWSQAVINALPILHITPDSPLANIDSLLEWVLGEGQFGERRWDFNFVKRIYCGFPV